MHIKLISMEGDGQKSLKPKGRMHIIDTTTVNWDINHNTNNTTAYKFTSNRNYGCFRERKLHLA